MTTMATNKPYRRSILVGLFFGITLSIAFGLGFLVSDFSIPISHQSLQSRYRSDYLLLSEVESLLTEVYLNDLPGSTALEYGAIRGLLETLGDPTTFFIEPPVAQSEAQALAGTYGGIGVQVKRIESGEFALYPFEDGPAFEVGIRDDDILVAINDVDISLDQEIDTIDQSLRGEVIDDNGVMIRVRRNDNEIIEVFILFEVVNVPSVTSRVINEDSRIGYLQILRFTSRTPEELQEEMLPLIENEVEGLIVDLRNNSGGLLVESIQVADEFIDNGIIAVEKSRDTEKVFSANPGGSLTTIPLAILVNNRTASASELVAGAILDNGRGILIGQKTFGKGTVQQIFPLSDGSSIHITSAEWLTPNGVTIASNGLTPDIVMIPDETGRDVELGEAIRYISSILDKQAK